MWFPFWNMHLLSVLPRALCLSQSLDQLTPNHPHFFTQAPFLLLGLSKSYFSYWFCISIPFQCLCCTCYVPSFSEPGWLHIQGYVFTGLWPGTSSAPGGSCDLPLVLVYNSVIFPDHPNQTRCQASRKTMASY